MFLYVHGLIYIIESWSVGAGRPILVAKEENGMVEAQPMRIALIETAHAMVPRRISRCVGQVAQ